MLKHDFYYITAAAQQNGRITGGELTTIDQYPFAAAMLVDFSGIGFRQSCGGSILNEKNILSAAHCFSPAGVNDNPSIWRVRVGSTFSTSGGIVHSVQNIVNHPEYNVLPFNADVSVIHLSTRITFNALAQQVAIAGPSYIPADNDPIMAVGWGQTTFQGVASEQLKRVQVWVVNQEVCREAYSELLTDTMLCAGANALGQGVCQQDSGGPQVHTDPQGNFVLVGITAFGDPCGQTTNPAVTARVSSYSEWILANALQ
ncbi:trypsin domain-containing protein [Phthorimaea operculella]|nr:trypsin domain-containing protein [Phthorimaea operculella]